MLKEGLKSLADGMSRGDSLGSIYDSLLHYSACVESHLEHSAQTHSYNTDTHSVRRIQLGGGGLGTERVDRRENVEIRYRSRPTEPGNTTMVRRR